MLSGFALNVPACAIWPGITWSIMAALPPTAARGNPPPIALPRRSEADSPWQPSDRKSTRLNSSHLVISYAVFCLKKKIVTAIRINHVLDTLYRVLTYLFCLLRAPFHDPAVLLLDDPSAGLHPLSLVRALEFIIHL